MGFFDGGAKSLSFGEVGSPEAAYWFGKWRGGVIVNIGEAKQATNIDTKEPVFWPKSQDPMMQLPITLDTHAGRCPEPAIDEEDDGVRDWYVTKGKQNFNALRTAMKAAGVKDLAVGGTLYIRWIKGEGKRGDPRQFECHYEPPAQTSGGFMDDAPAVYDPVSGRPANERARAVNQEVQQSMPPQVPDSFPAQPSGAFNSSAQAAGFPGPDPVRPRFDPQTGQPLAPPPAAPVQSAPRFDPATGQPLAAAPAAPEPPRFDPATGEPMNDAARAVLGQPSAAAAVPPQQPAAAPGGWSPGQQTVPAGPPAQGVTNPWRR